MMLTKEPNMATMPMMVVPKAMCEKYEVMVKFLFYLWIWSVWIQIIEVNEANMAAKPMIVAAKAMFEKYAVILLLLKSGLTGPERLCSGQTIQCRGRASFWKDNKNNILDEIRSKSIMDNKL